MNSFKKTLRGCVSALSLGVLGAAGLSVTAVPAMAPAFAQKAPKPPKVSKEFGVPMNEALKALAAKDFATALAKADQAAPHALTPADKLAVEQIRTPVFANTGDKPKLIASVEAQLATGALDAEKTKQLKGLLGPLYNETGNAAKALEITKAYVAEYGGTAQQYGYLGANALSAKDYAAAQTMGKKAIEQSRAEGKPPLEAYHNLVIKGAFESKDMPAYYEAVAAAYGDYPKPELLKALVTAAEKAPKYTRGGGVTLDIYRSMAAAGQLTDREQFAHGEMAMRKSIPIEAENALKPLIDSGKFGGPSDPKAAETKTLFATIKSAAATDRKNGLASSEAAAAKSATGGVYAATADAYIGAGDYAKALELLQKASAKGGLTGEEQSRAMLHTGIAQFKTGDKAGARATLEGIKSDDGTQELARAWLLLIGKS